MEGVKMFIKSKANVNEKDMECCRQFGRDDLLAAGM